MDPTINKVIKIARKIKEEDRLFKNMEEIIIPPSNLKLHNWRTTIRSRNLNVNTLTARPVRFIRINTENNLIKIIISSINLFICNKIYGHTQEERANQI